VNFSDGVNFIISLRSPTRFFKNVLGGNMSNGFTVNSLATAFADRQLAHQNLAPAEATLKRKRVEWDFKVTGFNLATAAAVASLALAIIVSSMATFVLFVVVYNIRKSFMRAAEETALVLPDQAALDPALLNRIANLNPTQRRNEIAAHLEINDENWKVVQYQLLDFKVWMNWSPAAPRVVDAPAGPAPQPAAEAAAPPAAPAPAAAQPAAEAAAPPAAPAPAAEVLVPPAAAVAVDPPAAEAAVVPLLPVAEANA
jgi:hypothetical protein